MVQGEAMMVLLYIGIVVLGLIMGSFLNVVILRFGTGLSISRGRSRCFSCDHELVWYELLPLVSYLIQMGRCRHCGSRISIQYPFVEILTAGLFFLSMREMLGVGLSGILLPLLLTVVSFYVVIIVYDLRHKIIPDMFSYIVALLTLIFASISSPNTILSHIASGVGAFLFFYAFWIFSKGRWMGLGDGKLALSLGFLLGPSATVAGILIAFWSGAIISLILLARERVVNTKLGISMKSEIPFAPFIIFGTLFVYFLHVDMGTLGAFLTI
jgi:prepilin signal peptidase PulO-like enzyme (type II secretory pathway)